MLSPTIQDLMNNQIKHELYSAYLYLAISADLEAQNYPGAAKWMRAQAGEEVEHAMKFVDYIHDRGGRVTLQAIDQPPSDFGSLLDVFQASLAHEQKVTGLIHGLYAQALQENDYASQSFLKWFVDEQVEEEKSAGDVVAQLERIGNNPAGLFVLDSQLGKRSED
ncbi:MAG: ferritin [Anaerolineae bacterium]